VSVFSSGSVSASCGCGIDFISKTSRVALKKRSGISRPLPCVTRERAASVGGSPRCATTSVFWRAAVLGLVSPVLWLGAVPGAHPTTRTAVNADSSAVAGIPRTRFLAPLSHRI
jgi:hypothetical protein